MAMPAHSGGTMRGDLERLLERIGSRDLVGKGINKDCGRVEEPKPPTPTTNIASWQRLPLRWLTKT